MKNKVLFPFLKLCYKEYKPYFFALIFNALIISLQTIFTTWTLSIIMQLIEKGDIKFSIYVTILLIITEVLLFVLVKNCKRDLSIKQGIMQEKVDHMLTRKILSMPFCYLEDPNYLELKKNASFSINNMGAIYSLFDSISKIIANIISLIGLSLIIVTFDYVLIIVLFVGIILTVLIILMSVVTQMKLYQELLPINFKYGYYFDTIIDPNKIKELKFYSVYDILLTNFKSFGRKVMKNFQKAFMKIGFFQALTSIIRYAQVGFVYCLIGIKTINEKLPISKFSLIASSALSFANSVEAIIDASGDFIRAVEYIKPFMEFMNLNDETNPGTKTLEEIKTIEFDHVTFIYPNTEKIILNDVSFKFNDNEKISIVGLNGAGKTTIVKLLCRLYEPVSGTIKINGIDIKEYEKENYIKQISAVFQDYKLFAYSIKENIDPFNQKDVVEISKKVGIHDKISSLPHKYDSLIGKSYDETGVELSGGEKQKIAIARSLSKDASLLILDEPTSALDPLAEAEIYENFNSLSENKLSIYISHRMSSSIFCDRILVLDGGVVSDFDTHANLMKKEESLYYKLFTTQAKNYKI